MRILLSSALLIPFLTASCVINSGTGSTSSGAGGAGSTSTSSGGDVTGWTVVDLIDEVKGPDTVRHKGNSVVSAIWFSALDNGLVGLIGANDTFGDGGAVLGLSSPTKVDDVRFSGYKVSGIGASEKYLDIYGFFPTPGGLVAGTSYEELYLHTADMGKSFTLDIMGVLLGGGYNLGQQVWISKDSAARWHEVYKLGAVWATDKDPSASTMWTETWMPTSLPPTPNPLPNGACEDSISSNSYFSTDPQKIFWASPDGKTMVYGRGSSVPAGVCLSNDGGNTFYPKDFPNPPAGSATGVPYVVAFADATHGFAARANDLEPSAAYVYTTADAGATWTAGSLPASVNAPKASAAFTSGFWAPDGQHAWIVGFAGSSVSALLLKTADGGKTWTDISAGLATIPAAQHKIHTGFALDDKHIWIGGDDGALLYSSTGGE